MPFDGIVTKAVTKELSEKLKLGKINKIYQPTDTEILFTIRNNRKNYQLLLSVHPMYARIHLTDAEFLNPETPPMFCMVLRKHLSGAIIKNIEQISMERIIYFEFDAINEIGDHVTKKLMIEIMGKHSNIVLLDDASNKIINCIKQIPPFKNRHRTLLPGAEYLLPPSQNKQNITEINEAEFVRKLDFNAGKLPMQIVHQFMGISPLVANEFVHRTHLGTRNIYEKQFLKFKNEILTDDYRPAIYLINKDKEDFHVIDLTYLEKKTEFNDVNELLNAFYSNKAERDRIKQQTKDLERIVKNELDKNIKKIKIHEKTLAQAKGKDNYQKMGELLTAHLHLVQRGDKSVTVVDYYDPEQKEIKIPLQTDKSPSENAQIFFKRYRKLAQATVIAEKELIKTEREIIYLEQILQHIEAARDVDIEEIREELRDEGYLKKQRKKKQKSKQPKPEIFLASDGTTIYVGKNNKQNDYVTHKLARKEDIWLHTLDIPGSHVVIKASEPSEETITEAAHLAAYFSKAKESVNVPVDFTKIKYVKKVASSKPGFVTYTEQQTLSITPDANLINQLRKNYLQQSKTEK